MMENLVRQVAQMIITRCKLNGVDLDTCDYDAPLFMSDDQGIEGSFELDSVDALELVAGVKEEFGIVMDANEMNVFYSVNSLAQYIEEHMQSDAIVN